MTSKYHLFQTNERYALHKIINKQWPEILYDEEAKYRFLSLLTEILNSLISGKNISQENGKNLFRQLETHWPEISYDIEIQSRLINTLIDIINGDQYGVRIN